MQTAQNRMDVIDYIADAYGVEAEYPWQDENLIFRHRENGKWFGAILQVRREKLGLPGEGIVDVLNLKCDAILGGTLRTQPGFHPAYHMNKEKWISIRLDGTVPMETVKNLIAVSYDLTGLKPKKKKPTA